MHENVLWILKRVHNGHFIIKGLAVEFKKQFTCLSENSEKYITFTVPLETEVTRKNW